MKRHRFLSMFYGLALFSVYSTITHAETYTGYFEPEDPSAVTSTFSATIPISLVEDSDFSFTINEAGTGCTLWENVSSVYIPGAPTGTLGRLLFDHESPRPLKAGDYEIYLECYNSKPVDGPPIAYQIETHVNAIYNTIFMEDEEPDSEEIINIVQTTVFEGWTDITGYSELLTPDDHKGYDGSDIYYLNIPMGTSINIKLEWDIRDPSQYNRCYYDLNGWEDGQTKLPNIPVSGDSDFSGDISRRYEMNYMENGSYRLAIDCVPTGDNDVMAYKVTIMVDEGEEPPPPPTTSANLKLKILSATWRKNVRAEYSGVEHIGFVIDYEVENPNAQSKQVSLAAIAEIPIVPDSTWAPSGKTSDIRNVFKNTVSECAHDQTDWATFCANSETPTGSCKVYEISRAIPAYSIAPYATEKKTNTLMVPKVVYNDIAEGLQAVLLRTMVGGVTTSDACYLHGTYFLPLSSFLPGVYFLLKEDK